MHVVLINSPSLTVRPVSRSMAGGLGFDGNDEMILPPLDLAIMAATLRNAGETVQLIDADPLGLDAHGVYGRLAGQSWDAIIGTMSLPTFEQDAAFLAEIRSSHPNAQIIGKTMVREHEVLKSFLVKSRADFVIHGEADLNIPELLHGQTRSGTAWLDQSAPHDMPTFQFDEGIPVQDLNTIPFPARDLLPNSHYRYPLLGAPVATIQTSRGCPYPCGYYCPYPLVEGVKWRAQSPERIFAELKEVVEGLGIRNIYFRDATFTLNQGRVQELCELIIRSGWKLEWVCETRVDCLGDDLLERMKSAGCVGLLVGVETGDEEVMHCRDGKKGLTVPKLAHLREKTFELGIRLHFLLIVGLPRETRESIIATYDLIQRYKPDTVGITIITPYPGTPLYEEGIREGWIDSFQWKDYGGHQVVMHTPHLTREDLVTGKQFLEEGFALLQQQVNEEQSLKLKEMASQHYEKFVRWGYQLDESIAELQQIVLTHSRPSSQGLVPEHTVSSSSKLTDTNHSSSSLVSVIIPTYNRRDILRKTLLALSSQTVTPDLFEVIVVDDGSSDDTMTMLQKWEAPFQLRVFSQSHGGPNVARNFGLQQAKSWIVLYTGDDMVPGPSFLEGHLKFHKQHEDIRQAMLGLIEWSPELTVTPLMHFITSPEGGQQFAFHRVKDGMADFFNFYTGNISLKREFLCQEPGPFDTDFTYPAYDDTELAYRLTRRGMKLHYKPQAVTYHHHHMTSKGFAYRQRNAGRMAHTLVRKHPELRETLQIPSSLEVDLQHKENEFNKLLNIVVELEKPDPNILCKIIGNGETFDKIYARNVLYSFYSSLLDEAHKLGVYEGARAGETLRTKDISRSDQKEFEVSIVIPVFNKVELTRQCLISLAEVTDNVHYEVIVVNNASTDGTESLLATLGGDVQIIQNKENLGFAKGCNQGAHAARSRYVVFLNNDTIPKKGWLISLVDEVTVHPDVAVVGSKLLYPDDTIQHAGVVFSRQLQMPYHLFNGVPESLPAVNTRKEFQVVTAACILVRKETFEQVGGFDEGFVNGFEDVDLCLRIRQMGKKVVYQPKSCLYHLESQTSGRKNHEDANAMRLFTRWEHQWLVDEDLVAHQSGYFIQQYVSEGKMKSRLTPISEVADPATWKRIVELQQLLLGQQYQPLAQMAEYQKIRGLLDDVEKWPSDIGILEWVGSVCEILGCEQEAIQFWEKLLTIGDHPNARLGLARATLKNGNHDDAQRHLDVLKNVFTPRVEAWSLQGVLSMQRQEYSEAKYEFEQALAFESANKKALMGLGMACLGLDQIAEAWSIFEKIVYADPDNFEAIRCLMQAGTALQKWESLARHLVRFIERNPADCNVRFALAGVQFRAGQSDQAKEHVTWLRLIKPDYEGLEDLEKLLGTSQSPNNLVSTR
jgi:GT2 family glycosyltransferase/radical SAM superfamily enzyme YgiQ (UPF0313 family)/tetratricopeptide (TPR) repeat protein